MNNNESPIAYSGSGFEERIINFWRNSQNIRAILQECYWWNGQKEAFCHIHRDKGNHWQYTVLQRSLPENKVIEGSPRYLIHCFYSSSIHMTIWRWVPILIYLQRPASKESWAIFIIMAHKKLPALRHRQVIKKKQVFYGKTKYGNSSLFLTNLLKP